jgi:sugar phosphate isomerase/epimerase
MPRLTLGYLTLDAPPVETVSAAAAAGFKSVGIRITGRRVSDSYPQVIGNAAAIREIRQRVDDGGLRLANISAYHLFPDVTLSHLQAVVDTTAELGSSVVVAICNQPDQARFADLFARYCEMAAKSGIAIALEFMRYCDIRTIGEAERVVTTFGQPSTGLLVDALHLDRSGGTVAELAKVDPRRIAFFQLCDARKPRTEPTLDELRAEARTSRLPPGEGDLPLFDLLDALPDSIEIEYEVPRAEQASLPLEQRARIAAQALRDYMARYAAARTRSPAWS